jgi:hypothetical protein
MHCFDDLQFKFELLEKLKKDKKYMKYSKNSSKNTKIGNQALINVPLAKKKLNPKTKKLLLCREPGGALGIGTCAEGGPSAQRCTLPTAPANSRQRPVNRGKPWSTALPRAGPRLLAQVASLSTASRSGRRQSYIFRFLNSVTFAECRI